MASRPTCGGCGDLLVIALLGALGRPQVRRRERVLHIGSVTILPVDADARLHDRPPCLYT
jgi:hypothetical protein